MADASAGAGGQAASDGRLAFPPLLPQSDQKVIRRGRQSLPQSPDRLLGPSLRVCVVAEELVVRLVLELDMFE